ncbi:hypothetical protein D9M68_421510 [compost metagenome]
MPRLALIYPHWSGFQRALPVFDYGQGMNLWVLPFELDSDHLLDAESAGIPLRQESGVVAERSELVAI